MTVNAKIDQIAIGKRIMVARKAKNLTQRELADMVGVATTYMNQLEKGKKQFSLQSFINIAKALDVSLDYLVYGTLPQITKEDGAVIELMSEFDSNERAAAFDRIREFKEFTAHYKIKKK